MPRLIVASRRHIAMDFLSSLLLSAVEVGVIDDMFLERLEGQAEDGRKTGSEPR
mgnify:CR=1 FL=1